MSRRRTLQDRGTSRTRSATRPDVESVERLRELEANPGPEPILTESDTDADWGQDVVDDIGRALGVPQAEEAQVRTSAEILRDRDLRYWDLERKAVGDPPSS